MKIYIDLVLIVNFFFDFFILYGVKYVLKNNTKLFRLLLGSIVGSLSILILFISINNFTLFIIKLFISLLMIVIAFGTKSLLKNILYFYLISIVLGGSLYLLDISYIYSNKGLLFFNNGLSINFIIILVISPIIIYLYVKENRSYKNKYSNVYITEIYMGNKVYKLKSLLDTGNNLKDPYTNKNIIIVNSTVKLCKGRFVYVPYKALNTSGLLKCYKPNRVIINNKIFNNCLIGLSKEKIDLDDIDCILPNIFKEEL